MSCAHLPRSRPRLHGGRRPWCRASPGRRAAAIRPTLLNRIMLAVGDDRQMWDGRADERGRRPAAHALRPGGDGGRPRDAPGPAGRHRVLPDPVRESRMGACPGRPSATRSASLCDCLVTGDAPYDHLVRWRAYETLPADLLADDSALAARHAEARGRGRAASGLGRGPPRRGSLLRQPGLVQRLPQRRQLHRRAASTTRAWGSTEPDPDLGRYLSHRPRRGLGSLQDAHDPRCRPYRALHARRQRGRPCST